jgi:O-acetyl-ADP-ribose deacetylase (regulator of RNase III)
MVKEVIQDIFDSKANALIHGCNCFCTMSAGLAKEIKERFPQVFNADRETESGDIKKLGTFTYAGIYDYQKEEYPDLKVIYNLYSQYSFGREKRHTDYGAFCKGLEEIRDSILNNNVYDIKTIGIPFGIGCGLGGGRWVTVKSIIQEVFENSFLNILICKKP